MKQKSLNWVAGIIFSLVSILHLVRSILGWEAIIGGVLIPVGASVVAFLISGFLAYSAFKLTGREKLKEENKEKKDDKTEANINTNIIGNTEEMSQ